MVDARRRILDVLVARGPVVQEELLRRLGNVSGRDAVPAIRSLIEDDLVSVDDAHRLSVTEAGASRPLGKRPETDSVSGALRAAGLTARIAEAEALSLLQTGMLTRRDGRLEESEAVRIESRVDRALSDALLRSFPSPPSCLQVHAGTARALGLRIPDHFGDGEDVLLDGISCSVDREVDFARTRTVKLDFVAKNVRRIWT